MARGNPQPWFRPSRNTWYATIDGVQKNLRTADRQAAYDRWHELMANGEKEVVEGEGLLVVDLLALFAEHYEKHHKPSTYDWYRGMLESFIAAIPKSLAVGDLKPYHVSRWLDGHDGWSNGTRRGAVTAVKRAFQWAVNEGYLDRSPVARVPKPPEGRRETILTEEQRKLILAESSDREFRDFLTLLMETGARPQEVRQVEVRHVDLQNGLWVFPPDEHKTGGRTGRPRVVYLTPVALKLTKRNLARVSEGPLLRNSEGKPWTKEAVRSRLRRLRMRLKTQLPSDLCCYNFRHSYATAAIERGVDPITLAELMGHRDATMVARVYQHIDQRAGHLKAAALRATQRGSASSQAD